MKFKIKQFKNKIAIQFEENYEPIINSILTPKILLGATTTPNYQTLIFNATTIKKFKSSEYLLMETLYKMVYQLGKQIEYLIMNEHLSPLHFSQEYLYMIDDNFIYLPPIEEVIPIKKDNLYITYPFSHDKSINSPELTEIKELPATVHFKTIYYSLGCFFLYLFLKGKINIKEIEKDPISILQKSYLYGSKFYFFLERCFKSIPQERSFIFL